MVIFTRRRWVGSMLRFAAAPALVMALLGAAMTPDTASAQSGPSLVILVRHAEKAAVAGNDPPLSELGTARAAALAEVMRSSPPSAIIVTTLQRTALTAADVAKATGVQMQAIPIEGSTAAHVAAVAAAVKKQTGVVLVVGHSNTTPAIVKALGGPSLPDICDATYSHLFALVPSRDEKPASLVLSRYGANEAAPPASCSGMIPR